MQQIQSQEPTVMSTRLLSMRTKLATLAGTALAVALSAGSAQALSISDSPLFLTKAAEPLLMLTMANDEQLYHKAYTDFDDVDGDNHIDVSYKNTINYSGYFDPTKCYRYNSDRFEPEAAAANHDCSGVTNGRWSGNFLNWATMTRMDVLRQVLYGGYRSTDSNSETVLERAYVPPDNHAWIKPYTDAATVGKYTPYSVPITLCNVTPQGGSTAASETNTTTPRLRVASGEWTEWAAQESLQCLWTSEFGSAFNPSDAVGGNKLDEFVARVKVCDSNLLGAEACKKYPNGKYKPVGLLQDYADADRLAIRFGLMTGNYIKRKSGGILRKNVGRLVDLTDPTKGEINTNDGTFTGQNPGIIKSLDSMRLSRFQYGGSGYGSSGTTLDNCPFGQNSWNEPACSNWGSPMGEMYLESLRYFAGANANGTFSADDSDHIPGATGVPGPLKNANWINPYTAPGQTGGKAPYCAKPNVIAISTGVVSFDHNDYGGTSDIASLNVNAETDAIGLAESINGGKWYVGSITGGAATDVCTSQTVSALSTVTGICPEAAGLQGSFKIAGLASFVHKASNSLQTVGGKKTSPVDTYAVALAPPTPSINVQVAGATVKIIPVGYNIRNSNAMSMVNFRVISQKADDSEGVFFMNYENAPAGADYDNDGKGFLHYIVSGNTVKVIMHQTGASSGATQNMGYIIDGVSDAGTHYLLSTNQLTDTANAGGGTYTSDIATIDASCAVAGFVADPNAVSDELCKYNNATNANAMRNMRGVKTHTVGTAPTGLLKSPLWYAAKWGGYKDINKDGVPQPGEWDANLDGNPDTYFPVTNAGKLKDELKAAFNEIIDRNASASSASVNSGSISNESRVYQAIFNSNGWTGDLLAFQIRSDGTLNGTPEWQAADPSKMPTAANRNIFTRGSTGAAVEFKWTGVIENDAGRAAELDPSPSQAQDILNYLRGDSSNEQTGTGGKFRKRSSTLGDIISSSPLFVGAPGFRYRDNLESKSYFTFRDNNAGRTKVVYAGANDGMLHAFNAETPDDNGTPADPTDDTPAPNQGKEMFAYVPGAVFKNLNELAKPAYTHRYYVDGAPNMGDAFFSGNWHTVLIGGLNKGGQGIYALDITKPSTFDTTNVMWEFNDVGSGAVGEKGDKDLGFTYSRPAIVRLNNNKWAAIFGNGYNNSDADGNASTTGQAALYIVDIADGKVIRKISVPGGDASNPNGLATPAAVDFNGDTNADYVFAGDLLGNLWKFDLTGSSSGAWDVAYSSSGTPVPLYVAADSGGKPQPITSRPEVGRGPNGNGMVVLFGTGKFLDESQDKLATQTTQSFYGIYDPNSGSDAFTGRGALGAQTIDSEQLVTVGTKQFNLRTTSNAAPGTRGWYMDLVPPSPPGFQGERVVSNSLLRNGRIVFTTLIPDPDPCGFGGDSWLMELDAITGKRLNESPFDLNRDGHFDSADLVPGTTLPPSGMKSEVGITPEPGVLTDPKRGIEYKYMPGTKGTIQMIGENPGAGNVGRQSWRQIR
jgi:type IV pilus assembly protein PilY1